MPKINKPKKVMSGYARDKRTYEVRTMTFSEALNATGHINVLNRLGQMVLVKITGKVKTWKTRPGDCEVPWKFGMYEYGRIRFVNGQLDSNSLEPVVMLRELSEK